MAMTFLMDMGMAFVSWDVTVGSARSMAILLRFFPFFFFAFLLTLRIVLVGLQGAVIMLRSRNIDLFWRQDTEFFPKNCVYYGWAGWRLERYFGRELAQEIGRWWFLFR